MIFRKFNVVFCAIFALIQWNAFCGQELRIIEFNSNNDSNCPTYIAKISNSGKNIVVQDGNKTVGKIKFDGPIKAKEVTSLTVQNITNESIKHHVELSQPVQKWLKEKQLIKNSSSSSGSEDEIIDEKLLCLGNEQEGKKEEKEKKEELKKRLSRSATSGSEDENNNNEEDKDQAWVIDSINSLEVKSEKQKQQLKKLNELWKKRTQRLTKVEERVALLEKNMSSESKINSDERKLLAEKILSGNQLEESIVKVLEKIKEKQQLEKTTTTSNSARSEKTDNKKVEESMEQSQMKEKEIKLKTFKNRIVFTTGGIVIAALIAFFYNYMNHHNLTISNVWHYARG